MPLLERNIRPQLFAPSDFQVPINPGRKPVHALSFRDPEYFQRITDPNTRERLLSLVKDPVFAEAGAGMTLQTVGELFTRIFGLDCEVVKLLAIKAGEQDVVQLKKRIPGINEAGEFLDRQNVFLFGGFFIDPDMVEDLLQTGDFLSHVPTVIKNFGYNEMASELVHLREQSDTPPPLAESAVFANFPLQGKPQENESRLKRKLRERIAQRGEGE